MEGKTLSESVQGNIKWLNMMNFGRGEMNSTFFGPYLYILFEMSQYSFLGDNNICLFA